MATVTRLLTAEDYLQLPSLDRPSELVRGSVVMMDVPGFRHGEVGATMLSLVRQFLAPEVVFEVLSPSDRWAEALGKADEYLRAGVCVVCILDPETRTATLCRPEAAPLALGEDQPLALPELHAEFNVPWRAFFG